MWTRIFSEHNKWNEVTSIVMPEYETIGIPIPVRTGFGRMEIWRATTLHDWFDVESIYRKFTVTIASIPFSFLFYFAANVGCRRPLLSQRSTRTSRSHKVWCICSDNEIHVSINYHFLFDYEVVCLKQLCEYLLPSRVVWLCCTFHMYNVVATRCFLYPRMQSIYS